MERQGVDHRRFHLRVSDRRSVVLATELCKQLGIEVGETVIVDVADDNMQLHPFGTTLAESRALAASKSFSGILVDELRAERRSEAAHE